MENSICFMHLILKTSLSHYCSWENVKTSASSSFIIISHLLIVERYDINGLVETLPNLNDKRHGCGCTKFIVSFIQYSIML